ncbi:MAG: S9 family peptidase [Acidobacteria bacterium]|nr:S9 family peptidase [Acidobacteriota bacterium]
MLLTLRRLLMAALAGLLPLQAQAPARRPMTFMDVMDMRSVGSGSLSPDGSRVLYTITIPNWKAGKNFTDIFVADTEGKVPPRQMTFTKDKNESSPQWARDGRRFAFLSDREGTQQLYLMAVDGGEAQRVTDAKDGVHAFAFSRDGRWVAFLAGKAEERQAWLLDLSSKDPAPTVLTRHGTPLASLHWSPDSQRIFFLSPDAQDKDDLKRKEKKFDVRLVDQPRPPSHLWSIDLKDKAEKRWSEGTEFSVRSFSLSMDGRWAALRAAPADRHATDASEEGATLRLLDLQSGKVEVVVPKMAGFSAFSPDGKWLAYTHPDPMERLRNSRIHLLPLAGGPSVKLMPDWDASLGSFSWTEDSGAIRFVKGVGLDQHLFEVSVPAGQRRQLTRERGVLSGSYDWESKRFLFTFSDPEHPADYFVAGAASIGDRSRWVRVSDGNPQVAGLALGTTEAIHWKAPDGKMVEGTLVKPLAYEPGKRYPLVVQVHGGPAAADMNNFSARYVNYPHVYAAAGYLTLQPNYRGSSNYGEAFTRQIGGNFLRLSHADIMAGVDHLIREGMADPERLGMMGWSAGGHLSSWALTQTQRFKAISTGAGAVNWISMYAQSDTQGVREFYLKGRPYEAWDNFVNESALRFIKNAKTPTLIHVGELDQRVPKPQSDELHMALKKLGVPVEYIVYPGMPHGLTEPRYQLVKMVAEFNWFEKWIKGRKEWFDWKALLDTLPEDAPARGGEGSQPASTGRRR